MEVEAARAIPPTPATRLVFVTPDTLHAESDDEAGALGAERSRSLRIQLPDLTTLAVLPVFDQAGFVAAVALCC